MPIDVATEVVLQGAFGGSFDAVFDALGDPPIWLGAFAGGAFGAAIGALPAFAFTGFLVIAGAAAGVIGAPTGDSVGLVGIGFGHVFGPHISFAGGAAAAAYAGKKGYIGAEDGYHNGKDIATALGCKVDVLAVGGVFGLFGIAVEQLSRQLLVPVDPIPLAICASAVVHRVAFGYDIIGDVRGSNILDMSPFEHGEKVGAVTDGGEPVAGGNRVENGGVPKAEWLATEPWLGHMYKWHQVAAIGLVAGLASGYVAFRTGSPFLGFGISAASLLFLNLGVEKVPATHHMTLAGGTVFVALTASGDAALAGLSAGAALVAAGLFGVLAALIGEVGQRIFYAHGRTHFDPPAISIVVWTVLVGVLHIAGIVPTGVWIPGTV
ncbi:MULTISPECIES: hypothetical protein [unclassified Halorubrum]|uniref:hypothetical protein n=1 Tax=unclassified Halorubrum TaxID=2642239 RepID=UPI0015950008|nr:MULTISPECIES: hypothetical protein [unclassified Halorubrum]